MTEYEMEEFADSAVKSLREFINTEMQLVKEEHDFSSKLQSWDYVMGHLDERIPANMKHLHKLIGKISEKLLETRNYAEARLQNLKITEENKRTLYNLEKDVEHRDWKAVKTESKKSKKIERLEIHELKKLHQKLIDLMKIIKRSELIEAISEKLTVSKDKKKYKKLAEYYFIEIYKFARAYERIFRHLWRKERILSG